MAVIVKGMEMPEKCPCDLSNGYEIPFPCFAGAGVPKRHKEFDECVANETKPSWCPLVEVHEPIKPDTNLLEESGFEL